MLEKCKFYYCENTYTQAWIYQAHLYQVFAYIKDFLYIQISLNDSNVNLYQAHLFQVPA